MLSEGDTFLFDLSQNHHCTHDPLKPAALFTAYFHCTHTAELQALLQNGDIPRKNHPMMYHTNLELFEEAVKITASANERELWLAPIFQQLLCPNFNAVQQSKIMELCRMLDTAPQFNYSLEELATQAGYSKNQLLRLFRKTTGYTPYAYLIHVRIERAKHYLLFSDYTVTEIANLLGYNDLNHFSSQFFQKTGYYPSQYAATQKQYFK